MGELIEQVPGKAGSRFPLVVMLRRRLAVWRIESEGAATSISFILSWVTLRNIRFDKQNVSFIQS